MPNKRVTMQDIADACGLSRNTVSKVFNGRGAVPQATRAMILKKAEELGYGSPVESAPASSGASDGSIALLTHRMPKDAHVGTSLLTAFTDQISRSGYSLKMYEISGEELKRKTLPTHFSADQTAGIFCIELFDTEYLNMICDLGIPTLLFDGPVRSGISIMDCDSITMDSVASITFIMRKLIFMGASRIGFVGDKDHCDSFYERWYGYCNGLREAGLSQDDRFSILAPDDSPYSDTDWLIQQLNRMRGLPDAFVCANDFLAIHLMSALKKMGLSIPRDILVTGFDGTSQSALADPPLTTVQVPGLETGRMAAKILLSRITDPERPYTWTRVKTTPVWRSSSQK